MEFRCVVWRGSKCVYRVPAPLVPDGEARRTQQSHPSMLNGLGVHYGRFKLHSPLDTTPCGPTTPAGGPSMPATCVPSVLWA
jgi:hypothetical protein